MQKNILIYFQNSIRNIYFESLVAELIKHGHQVYFLTKAERGILQEKLEALGAITECHSPRGNKIIRFISHWRYFIRYCRKNKIDLVFSHLQLANLIALLSQNRIKAKVLPTRHHVDEIMKSGNRISIMIDKKVNRLCRKIAVVSGAVKRHMVSKEHVKEDKIVVIPLGYDFNLLYKPDAVQVNAIRQQMNCHLLLIIVARMTSGKRHILALQALNKLVQEGFDIKLMILDRGDEEQNLKKFVKENGLEERVLFTGFLNNIMDYVSAADLVLHPSLIEASNQLVREAAVQGKTSIVCDGIGNFNEYIVDRVNGFLVSQENTLGEMILILKEFYNKKDELEKMGQRLKEQVLSQFAIGNIAEEYLKVAETL